MRPDIILDGIDGGNLLATRSTSSLCFYDWDNIQLVRRIEISAKHVFWSENCEFVAITGEDSFYILKYNSEAVANADLTQAGADGVEEAFDVIGKFLIKYLKYLFQIKIYFLFNSNHFVFFYYFSYICSMQKN